MRVFLLTLISLFFIVSPASAEPDMIPRTGQTACYDNSGSVISCSGTKQDGETQFGTPWPSPRFVDNSDGTITDHLTGLMWLKDANCADTINHNPDGVTNGNMSWLNSLSFASGVNATTINISSCQSYSASYNDWHVPNAKEMESLLNYGTTSHTTWLSNAGFANVASDNYWTSTTGLGPAFGPNFVVTVDVSNGIIGPAVKTFSSPDPTYTWLVRKDTSVSPVSPIISTGQVICYDASNTAISCSGTGQDGELQQGTPWSTRFINNGDGTSTDQLTGLMWANDFPTGNASIDYARNYVAGMNAGTNTNFGYNDWRLPSAKEAFSLQAWSSYNLAMPSGYPFTPSTANAGWSSTASIAGTNANVMADFYRGGLSPNGKSGGASTYLIVRGTYPLRILSPVVGSLDDGSCTHSSGVWCFEQYLSPAHTSTGGVGSSNDVQAWDINLKVGSNTDADDGMPVYATASGVVENTYAGQANPGNPGAGQVLIKHDANGQIWWSAYLHMTNINVSAGDPVTVNTIIGNISDIGASNNHLHFVIYKGANTSTNLKSFDGTIVPR